MRRRVLQHGAGPIIQERGLDGSEPGCENAANPLCRDDGGAAIEVRRNAVSGRTGALMARHLSEGGIGTARPPIPTPASHSSARARTATAAPLRAPLDRASARGCWDGAAPPALARPSRSID